MIGANGRISAVKTSDGRTLAADLLVVGIGILPNVELAQAAGLDVQGGMIVDACGRTTDPAIVATGDCAARRMDDCTYR